MDWMEPLEFPASAFTWLGLRFQVPYLFSQGTAPLNPLLIHHFLVAIWDIAQCQAHPQVGFVEFHVFMGFPKRTMLPVISNTLRHGKPPRSAGLLI